MRFACEACHAQYLISDEKVGSAGVKVRCKKCGHVIVVKRPVAARTAPVVPAVSEERPADPARFQAPGLDAEVGAAVDGLAGRTAADGAERARDGGDTAGGGVPDPETTRVFPSAEMAQTAATAGAPEAPSSSPAEWFVAMDDEQVGPISFEELKRHWEAGAVGPESLCWRAGLGDWTAIAGVAELAGKLPARTAPAPQARPLFGTEGGAATVAREAPSDDPWNLPAPQPTSEFEWKPAAGSALASLVEQEVAALSGSSAGAVERAAFDEPPAPESTGIRSLLSNLPEPPPPEPSRVIPFPERSQTGAQPLPKAAAAQPARAPSAPEPHRPSSVKNAVVGGLVAAALVVALAVVLVWTGILPWPGGPAAPGVPPAAVVEAPAAPAAPPAPVAPAPVAPAPEAAAAATAPVPAEGAPAPAPAEAAGAGEIVAAAPPPEPAPTPEPAQVAPAPAEPAPVAAPTRQPTRRERRAAAARTARAQPAPTPEPPSEPVAVAPSGRRSDIDDLFEQEFSGSEGGAAQAPSGKRGDVYIPKAPGSAGSKPERLGQGDVMGVVVSHKADIKRCVEGYKAKGGGSGTLVMVWTILPSGKTAGVKPKGSNHAPLAKCMGGLIRGWKFPAYGGSTMAPIEFPFQF